MNKELRSLTVAAYLRILYASIEYAPTAILRNKAIKALRNPLTFRYLTQLCDITDWDEEKHITSKYARVVRSAVKIPDDLPYYSYDSENFVDQITYCEQIAKVVTLGLKRIKKKRDDDIPLTEGDIVTLYELCVTMFTILNQTNNFVFSNINFLFTHLMNEEEIAYEV